MLLFTDSLRVMVTAAFFLSFFLSVFIPSKCLALCECVLRLYCVFLWPLFINLFYCFNSSIWHTIHNLSRSDSRIWNAHNLTSTNQYMKVCFSTLAFASFSIYSVHFYFIICLKILYYWLQTMCVYTYRNTTDSMLLARYTNSTALFQCKKITKKKATIDWVCFM